MIFTSKIKCIGLDLDGTLLNNNKEIPKETVVLLRSLHENGMVLILVSGRHYREMERYARVLEFQESDFVISCDGQYIYDGVGKIMHTFPFLGKNDLHKISRICKNTVCYFYTDKEDYAFRPCLLNRLYIKFKHFCEGKDSKNMISDISSQVSNNIQIEKIRVTSLSEEIVERLRSAYIVHLVHPNGMGTEILNYKVNKYNAIKKLEELAEINLKQFLYFGNDYNDYECFEHLQYTIAMSDSPDAIKNMASYITDDCDHYGVYNALTTFLL